MRAPTAGLPMPVRDLRALRLGPQVHFQFTAPSITSDGVAYAAAKFGAIRYQVCVWPGMEQGTQPPKPAPPLPGAGVAAPPQVPARHPPQPGAHGQFSIPGGALMPSCPQLIAVSDHNIGLDAIAAKTTLVTLALAAENGGGDWAGWSNPVVVAMTPVAPPPRLDHIQLTADGVLLSWQAPQPEPEAIAIYRQQGSAQGQAIAHVSGSETSFLDRSITWNQDYSYWLRSAAGVGRAAAESADSRHLLIHTADVFPPPVPSGLQVVLSAAGDAVDLSWNAVAAHDLAGYNVYRRVGAAGGWEKRNASPLPTPVFHDELPSGTGSIAYAVTSVDTAGNESLRGPAVVIARKN